MNLTPYQPSRAEAAARAIGNAVRPANADDAAALWIQALGGPPRSADECITTFHGKGACALCHVERDLTLVLDGFKGVVTDGNAMVCDPCIDLYL